MLRKEGLNEEGLRLEKDAMHRDVDKLQYVINAAESIQQKLEEVVGEWVQGISIPKEEQEKVVKFDFHRQPAQLKHGITELVEGDSSRKIVEIIRRTSMGSSLLRAGLVAKKACELGLEVRVEKMFDDVQSKLPGPPKFLLCLLPERKNCDLYGILGGLNSLLSVEQKPSIPLVSKVPTIILGMDVSDGSPGHSDMPSIAAVIFYYCFPSNRKAHLS
ncbi:hypothetical protein Cgig2_010312 [Carnegiea gigantea]|uniref:Uncharacterized protein n=1 Tax=Carnegiea gigantea TaxID=171969 RepID=A0A9Q1QII3_9CARY|nr:hypothetical protein Cgig2_010312 [Carnegiea gigantea]